MSLHNKNELRCFTIVYSSYSVRAIPDEDGFHDVGNLDKDLETIFPAEK